MRNCFVAHCVLAVGLLAVGCGGGGGGDSDDSEPEIPACPTVESSATRPSQGVQQISAAEDHTCALIFGGTVRCWGKANYGVLGYGNVENIGDNEVPSSAGDVDVGAPVQQIATGFLNTCALLADGTVRCWGAVHTGVLDPDATDMVGDDEAPSSRPALNFGQPATQVSVGTKHACVLLQDQSVRCWGSNDAGQLGIVGVLDSYSHAESKSVELGGPVRSVSAGNDVTCAVLEDESVICWGSGGIAGLGYGNVEVVGDDETPLSVGAVSLGASAHSVSVGRYDRCAILECGDLRCWGLNRFGSAGLTLEESVGDDELPDSVPLVEIGGPVKRVSVGTEIADERSCAVLFDNTIRCWGNQWSDSEDWRPVATTPIDLDGTVVDVVVGDTHACALMGTGKVRCWGDNSDGQVGNGGSGSPAPNEVPEVDVTGS